MKTTGEVAAAVPVDTWLGLNEVQAVIITAAVAAAIALWGIFTQRALAARQATIQFLRDSERDKDMIEARTQFNRLARMPDGLGKWGQTPGTDEAAFIRTVLNEYELIAIGIQRGILDDTTYRRWHRSAVIKNWRIAAPYIMAVRARINNDAVYHEFEEMARWYNAGDNMPRRIFLRRFF